MKALLGTLAIPLAFAGMETLAQVPEKKPMPTQTYVKRTYVKLNPAGEKGSRLGAFGVLKSGEFMVGPGRQSFAMLHTDGNFCFYRGDPSEAVERAWCSEATAGEGEYHAILWTDGNFCVNRGTPGNGKGKLWCSANLAPQGYASDKVYLTVQAANISVVAPGLRYGAFGETLPDRRVWNAP